MYEKSSKDLVYNFLEKLQKIFLCALVIFSGAGGCFSRDVFKALVIDGLLPAKEVLELKEKPRKMLPNSALEAMKKLDCSLENTRASSSAKGRAKNTAKASIS